MLQLSEKWAPRLLAQPESGMGYQLVEVRLLDGRVFRDAIVVGGCITQVQGSAVVPFVESEIADLVAMRK